MAQPPYVAYYCREVRADWITMGEAEEIRANSLHYVQGITGADRVKEFQTLGNTIHYSLEFDSGDAWSRWRRSTDYRDVFSVNIKHWLEEVEKWEETSQNHGLCWPQWVQPRPNALR